MWSDLSLLSEVRVCTLSLEEMTIRLNCGMSRYLVYRLLVRGQGEFYVEKKTKLMIGNQQKRMKHS